LAIAARLPPGSGVIYRAFGAPDALETARALARLAHKRGLVLLVGADERLAAAAGAHGLHLPERDAAGAPRVRARRPNWLITAAAHSPRALAGAGRAGCDAALVSAVFESRSPSAGRPIGPRRFARLVRTAGLPVYALGGVDARTARRLLDTGAVGLAAVEGFGPA
jgi:thiamine-phosphate pyrophosphorylase